MAPEQLRGEPVDPAWDVWALAVIVFEMLTGSLPVAGATVMHGGQSLAGYSTMLTAGLDGKPEPWHGFFRRALAPDRAARPSSARALLADLERAVRP
jgi:serine/threonine protein kinase